MTQSFAMPPIAKRLWKCLAPSVTLVILACVFQTGCSPSRLAISDPSIRNRDVSLSEKSKSSQVLAQGRIQPAKGLIRVSAIPGDRVEQVLVQAGQRIQKLQPLIVLQSQQLRALELEAASLRLEEARAMRQVKQQEADLADRKSTRLNSSHVVTSRMPSSA